MSNIEVAEFPTEGYSHLALSDVFQNYGIVHGLTELDRRANYAGAYPSKTTSKAEIAAEIIHGLVSKSLHGTEAVSMDRPIEPRPVDEPAEPSPQE